jgi:glycerol-3-phosphate acyltransferase PlsY
MSAAAQQVGWLVPVAYLLGSVPFGLIVGRSRGVDPRTSGSGNIGATNVGRLLGRKFFALVFTLDLLKGLLPMLAAAYALREEIRGGSVGARTYALWLLVGAAAIAGHMFSVFLRFKGGKGVATSTGVLLGLWPYYTVPALIGAAVWLAAFKAWRYVSLASMAGSVAFPLAYLAVGLARGWDVFGAQLPLLVFAVVMAGLIVFKHRSNIARLRAGTEFRGSRPEAPGEPANPVPEPE